MKVSSPIRSRPIPSPGNSPATHAAIALLTLASSITPLVAEPIRGPFWSGTVMKSKDQPAAAKGLAITLGSDRRSYVVYDLDTLRPAVAWSGEFLEFGNTLTKIEWPPPPMVKGTNLAFFTVNAPGWSSRAGGFLDPRPGGQGPLPKEWAHYEGLYVHGDEVVLKYRVGGLGVLESPSFHKVEGREVFARTIQFEKSAANLRLLLASGFKPSAAASLGSTFVSPFSISDGSTLIVGGAAMPRQAELRVEEGNLILALPKVTAQQPFILTFERATQPTEVPLREKALQPRDLRKLTAGGPARWTETIATEGRLDTGGGDGSYVVDTLTEPFPNPYGVSTFLGGFDFLPDGRAAVCTFHGDVWIVSGIDDTLKKLSWKRYATGLFQPLGLKVVKGQIYVAGRDQITRLHDVNNDGEADFYENFNNDTIVTPNYHEFVLDLHTDSKGNFYFAKGAPWEPSVTSPHQGTILKVSPDGKNMEVFATGLRAPNGMTVGPDDTVLVGDNQGHWMPSSKLNLVRPGAFLGMVPAAQKALHLRYPDGREIHGNPSDPNFRKGNALKGWDATMPIPTAYDEPIAWLPMRWDNSSGGQVYVTSDKWGPWKGAPLFMSYGKCLLYGVTMDRVEGTTQAALVPFGLKFPSGIMRGRFHPKDGQLYVCGLKGWQNAATRDGGLYRVRYTGKPVRTPVAVRTAGNGIELRFAAPLDAASARLADNYAVEIWNYRYSGAYGSPELSVKNPGKAGHDTLKVT
ncbi:MAG: DUF6797 domain-containing protein [Verrucomicrobiota bacterium]